MFSAAVAPCIAASVLLLEKLRGYVPPHLTPSSPPTASLTRTYEVAVGGVDKMAVPGPTSNVERTTESIFSQPCVIFQNSLVRAPVVLLDHRCDLRQIC